MASTIARTVAPGATCDVATTNAPDKKGAETLNVPAPAVRAVLYRSVDAQHYFRRLDDNINT